MITRQMNSKSNIKQYSDSDIPSQARQPVLAKYGPVDSTANQTVINLNFMIDTVNNPNALMLTIDGRMMSFGAAADFTFTSIDINGFSSQVTLTQGIQAGLNVQAWKLGLKKESELGVDQRFIDSYSVSDDAFQGYTSIAAKMTATVTTGSPGAGNFYSSIQNRSSMPDFNLDLRARMGLDTINCTSISPIYVEQGPNGEQVFGAVGDTKNQIRFVGTWYNNDDSGGYAPATQTNLTDYCEVTFYGTGLNVLTRLNGTRNFAMSVDGGSETVIHNATSSAPIPGSSYYNPSTLINVVQGLTLGVHTVKIRNNTVSGLFQPSGFQILNASTNVTTSPGVSILAGKKITTAAQSIAAYNTGFESGTLGTRGGRVLVYQKSDGSIAKAVTPANASQANLASADHTNEEVVRVINYREFGIGRSDDLSTLGTTTSSRAYTLDDGVTTLAGNVVYTSSTIQGLFCGTSGYHTFTFVGTGLDVMRIDSNGTLDSHTIFVNGASIGSITGTGTAVLRRQKIVSGLPYGTHTVKIQRDVTVNGVVGVESFLVYGPKKPTLPSGAIELAEYNIMANYVGTATTIGGYDLALGTGVLRRYTTREFHWGSAGFSDNGVQAAFPSGRDYRTSTNGDFYELTFFGTGIEIRTSYSTTANPLQIGLDGAAYTGAATAKSTGGSTWTPGTSTWQVAGSVGASLEITGLSLGMHKLRVTKASATDIMIPICVDVITPIHAQKLMSGLVSHQNLTASVGMLDNRKASAVRGLEDTQLKNISQASGITPNPTTTATSPVPLPDMVTSHLNKTGRIKISYSGVFTHSTTSDCTVSIFVNGVYSGRQKAVGFATASAAGLVISDSIVVTCTANVVHTIQLFWQTSSGTATANSDRRNLLVEEA